MPRKVKSRLAPKIIKVFESRETDELRFQTIFDEVGVKKATLVGVLSSYPGIFSKPEGRRTQWRLIPEEDITLEEFMELYDISPEMMLQIIDEETRNIRYYCWEAPIKECGKYERRDLHYIYFQMKKNSFRGLTSATS